MPPRSTTRGEAASQNVSSKTSRPARASLQRVDQTALKSVLLALELVVLAAVYSPVSQLSMTPVYGSIPPGLHHSRLMMAAVLLGFVAKSAIQRYVPRNIAYYLPIHAFLIPPIQILLFRYSGDFGPIYGPLVTEFLTYFPLAFISIYAAAMALDSLDLSRYGERMQNSGPAIVSYLVFNAVEKFSTGFILRNVGTSLIFTRTGLQFVLAIFYALLLPSRALLFAAFPVLHFASMNVHVPLQRTTLALNTTLQMHGYSLLARQESLTGYISVLENLKDGFRVMRCDHSLLGGEWIPPPSYRWIVKDPIYSVFTTLEAVRLVQDESSKIMQPDSDYQPNALVIGLGIGTTPSALIAHGVHTTTVELDPTVHDFAMQYFNLPLNHTSIIQDAVLFVEQTQLSEPEYQTYHYIIHDVFTGGAEPAALFTHEFIQGLSNLLKPNGVIAINYAGDLLLPSTALVVSTISSVFPSCRLFREDAPGGTSPGGEAAATDFTNMIMFCKKSEGPVTFRDPVEADYLGSDSRRQHLLPQHEIASDYFDSRLKEGTNKILTKKRVQILDQSQRDSAVGHWRIMRTVLPDAIWENW